MASLLEVGTGFHPELTGRENIYLNSAIARYEPGRNQNEVRRDRSLCRDRKFLDTPIKRYTSGMYVRFAFAVAAHLEPEILFWMKSSRSETSISAEMPGQNVRGRSLRAHGAFVSHNMASLFALCKRGIVLDKGRKQSEGLPRINPGDSWTH